MHHSVAMSIAATEARCAVELLPEASPIEDRLRAAMKVTYRHWMATDENDQFIAACEGVYGLASDDEKERIESELRSLSHLAAMLDGVPIDMDAMAAQIPTDPIGLRKLWIETVS